MRFAKGGEPLRVAGAMIASCADWAWHKQISDVRGWQGEGEDKQICMVCNVGLADAFDFCCNRVRAPMCTMRDVRDKADRVDYLSKIYSIPGFTHSVHKLDWMHCICLAILPYRNDNVMYELYKELKGTRDKTLDACGKLLSMTKAMAIICEVDMPFASFTAGMIRGTTPRCKPKLKLKAAEGRHFLPILVEILRRFFKMDTEHKRRRYNCVLHLKLCYDELANWTENSPQKLAFHGRRHLQLYKALSEKSSNELFWHLYPKHHVASHVL